MMPVEPSVRLKLVSRPENVLMVRETLGGLADVVGLDRLELHDMRTAVSEACNNVVAHAYDGGEGPLWVDVSATPNGFDVLVSDAGNGIPTWMVSGGDLASSGIGARLISTLADGVEVENLEQGGSTVRMHFSSAKAARVAPRVGSGEEEPPAPGLGAGDHAAMVTVARGPLARAIVQRLSRAGAARAHFSAPHIAATQLAVESLVVHSEAYIDGNHVAAGISVVPRGVELALGPLRHGSARGLLARSGLDGLRSLLQPLTDDFRVLPVGSSEALVATLAEAPD